ncbi:hypothetical protein NM208_g4572 [Fusarium decemcellulare]|uniref:Uncharacterized protein n=1 Tax=Fusarium decemcellulare TaxID=57161 RepID=A0ACC1SK64_9HYPO|nr:hypothetical protein NM208_g4572 [Fusarium decemcellulare]
MAGKSEDGPVYKRRRVAQACQTCRAMKSKCDGKQPECGRCVGYGFTCAYAKGRLSRSKLNDKSGTFPHLEAIDELRGTIDHYEELLHPNRARDTPSHPLKILQQVQHFREINIDISENVEQDFDSYEQEGEVWAAKSNGPTALPIPDEARELTEVYFSTIHLAYPFIPQSLFMETWGEFRAPLVPNATDLAILYVICAIGSYYTSFPARDKNSNLHELYFQRAMALTSGAHRSINYVSLLLVQCFYFLAICKTDSCWTTLGQAVRIAQSIGLHVESRNSRPRTATELERRRRVWYSIYVLDRLLSLQLGRPPAIHDDDCSVPLPCSRADSDIDWASNEIQPVEGGPSVGDYFIAVIAFSRIVGYVLRDIYGPTHERPTAEMIRSTQCLDRQLVEWKLSLPRKLRFDLGHAFDQNVAFRRQMDWPLVSLFEKTCASEARETARLLHHVSDERDLVHDFPWWQMISCLICAGSILLVSSIFIQQPTDDSTDFDSEGLRDDAETCLKMFEALSVNSKSARVARDMIKGLKQCGSEWNKNRGQTFHPDLFQQALRQCDGSIPLQASMEIPTPELTIEGQILSAETPQTPQNWPAEIIDSMAWSSQFFSATQGGSGALT